MASTRGRQVVIPLTNKSGASVAAGDVVVIDSTADDSFTTTTTARVEIAVGVAQETIANNAAGRVLIAGYAALINVPASVTRKHYIETHTVAKQATGNSTRRSGSFGQFLKTSATPSGWLWGPPDVTAAGSSLTSNQGFLGADVTMTTANTFYDGPTYTPAAGTWLLMATAIIVNGSGGGADLTCKIWDGTTAYVSTQETSGGANFVNSITLSVVVTASGSQVFKMSVAANANTFTMRRHPSNNNTGLTGLGTTLLAVRIA